MLIFFYSTRRLLIRVLRSRLLSFLRWLILFALLAGWRSEREGIHHEIEDHTPPGNSSIFFIWICGWITIYCVDGEDTLWRVLWGKTGQTNDPLYLRVLARRRIICINCSFLNERARRRGGSAIGGTLGDILRLYVHRSWCSSRKHVERGAHRSTHRWVEQFCASCIIRMLYTDYVNSRTRRMSCDSSTNF